ncbi:DNA-3-methyladenine glycosylase family protein [Alkaliphilus oremlandii]|uniref:DNA-(apurinic or apyrimidinic site) lyase n=1 Tax=Alkaliphilus oremlandii (strain OhILAs) TaxID=350688 RepID=A8MJK0_ALKOO|nr:DNA glycosylase [Alkaliphilus oremlandii]ABW19982.1 8-oxoguanine DNA glycosylase domain protein [Alkaliphilus oremlandii OhILAs]
MEIVERDQEILVKNLQDFDPKHIFECGQCFRWDKEQDGSYTGVAFGKVLNVKKEEDNVIFKHSNKEEFHKIWIPYFDLDKDYGKIKAALIKEDEIMKSAADLGNGIRILQQDSWETLISFIISSNNNIPRIKKAVNLISERFGLYLGEYDGKKQYSFPEPEVVCALSNEELTSCGVGYRAKYIIDTAKAVVEKNILLDELKKLDSSDCFEALLQFNGVGPKVANCILFFAMGKVDAFPVDVWVKRVMEHFYFKKDTPNKEIERFAKEKFGEYAGYGQQYLFYYAREAGIGK